MHDENFGRPKEGTKKKKKKLLCFITTRYYLRPHVVYVKVWTIINKNIVVFSNPLLDCQAARAKCAQNVLRVKITSCRNTFVPRYTYNYNCNNINNSSCSARVKYICSYNTSKPIKHYTPKSRTRFMRLTFRPIAFFFFDTTAAEYFEQHSLKCHERFVRKSAHDALLRNNTADNPDRIRAIITKFH